MVFCGMVFPHSYCVTLGFWELTKWLPSKHLQVDTMVPISSSYPPSHDFYTSW
jgi:hypothetical protein